MRKLFWTLLILLLLAGLLTVTLPARMVWRSQAAKVPDVELSQIEGTIWQGSAGQLSIRKIALGQLQWRLHPGSLLTLSPTVDLTLTGAINAKAEVTRTSEKLIVRNLSMDTDASWLKPAIAVPAVEPTGQLLVELSSLIVNAQGLPEAAVGTISLRNAGISGLVSATLDDVQIELGPQLVGGQSGIKGVIQSKPRQQDNAMIRVQGEFSLVGRNYDASIRVEPKQNQTQPNDPIQQVLKWIGAPADNGARLLLIRGELLVPAVKS